MRLRRTAISFVIAAALLIAPNLAAQAFTYDTILTLRGMNASGPLTWLEKGQGRLDSSDGNHGFATAQFGADWDPSEHFDAHAQILGRAEPSGYGGRRAGLVEAFVEGRAGGWQLRAGQFFLPTSRENTQSLWSSPYALSLSALNDWIAQEFRPIGVDLQWKTGAWTFGATAFRGNDTTGTLLGWRGWTIGNRISVTGETLPVAVPPAFVSQKDGTTAYGPDIDGHTGFAGRVRFSVPERGLIQLTHIDNGGDRELYGDQYSWQTRFDIIGAEFGSLDSTKVAAELSRGTTGMGFAPAAFVNQNFHTWYFLVSQKIEKTRWTARYDAFATIDKAHSFAGNTGEHGRAWILAGLYEVTPHIRAGAEFAQVTGHRDAVFDGRSITLELRYALR